MSIKWCRRVVCVSAGLSLGNAAAAYPDAHYYTSFSNWPLMMIIAAAVCLACALVGLGMAAPGKRRFNFGAVLLTGVMTAIGVAPLYLDGLKPPPELIVVLTVGALIVTLWCKHEGKRKSNPPVWWA